MYKGCFVGLSTYDIIYEVEKYPGVNEKIVAKDQLALSGGPATNAAITFSLLSGRSSLLSAIGRHPVSELIQKELNQYDINLIDLDPQSTNPPAVSSVLVQKNTSDRAVVSVNASKNQISRLAESKFQIRDWDIVLVDGHQIEVSKQVCALARKVEIPCVLDGGSWKPGTEALLQYIDYAICSEDFLPPGCTSSKDVVAFLCMHDVKYIAITRGAKSIITAIDGKEDTVKIQTTSQIRSTLGAGDILHGAFCYFLLSLNGNLPLALKKASQVATISCEYKDTRGWANDKRIQQIIA